MYSATVPSCLQKRLPKGRNKMKAIYMHPEMTLLALFEKDILCLSEEYSGSGDEIEF